MQLTENRAATIAGWLKLDRSSDGVGTRLRRKWAPCHVKLGPLKSDHTIILYLKGPNDEAIIGMIKLKNFLSGSFSQPVRKSFFILQSRQNPNNKRDFIVVYNCINEND